ncbi:MAG: PTS transporter subunit EIIC [Lactobacillus sp.]|nr:PTS transporter subunit EIIC [Lactobacillus sp.]
MRQIIAFLEDYILPFAERISKIRFLLALRNAFVSLVPLAFTGSVAVVVKNILVSSRDYLGLKELFLLFKPLLIVSNLIWQGTLELFAVYLAISLGYQLAKSYEVNRMAGSLLGMASFALGVSNFEYFAKNIEQVDVTKAFALEQLSTGGVFTAIVCVGIGMTVFVLMSRMQLVLRFSYVNSHAEKAAFDALLPMMGSLTAVGLFSYFTHAFLGQYFYQWLFNTLQKPLVNSGQGWTIILLITLLITAISFLGINGAIAFGPIIDSIWMPAQNANVLAEAKGQHIPFIWTSSSFSIYGFAGGFCGMGALVLAILLVSKRQELRAVAKLGMAPSFFNLGEPVMFGVPVAFNPLFLVPLVACPVINITLAYMATKFGLVHPVTMVTPSVVPPVISAFLATNYDWRAIILTLINLALAVMIWIPFVKASDRIEQQSDRSYFASRY